MNLFALPVAPTQLRLCLCAALAVGVQMVPPPARAHQPAGVDDTSDTPPEVSLTLEASTDYRFRGTTYSAGDPTLFAEVEWRMAPRWTLRAEAARVQFGPEAGLEATSTIAWETAITGVRLTLEARATVFAGIADSDQIELAAMAERKIGPFTAEADVVYVPASEGSVFRRTLYAGAGLQLPIEGTSITLATSFGHQFGGMSLEKSDWAAGCHADLGDDLSLALEYVGTDASELTGQPTGTVVLSLARSF